MLVTAQVRPMGYGPEDAARNSRVYHLYYGPHAETECRPHAHVRCAPHVDRINVLCGLHIEMVERETQTAIIVYGVNIVVE
jgi:hypothetical protein